MAAKTNPNWPVLTHYDQRNLGRIALGLGGIGTGTVSLGGRGDLRDWELVNRPAKGFTPKYTFFALYAKAAGKEAVLKCPDCGITYAEFKRAGITFTTASRQLVDALTIFHRMEPRNLTAAYKLYCGKDLEDAPA